MSPRRTARFAIAVVGGLVSIAVLHGVLLFVGGADLTASITSDEPSWVVPLATGGVIGAVTWLLLEPEAPRADNTREQHPCPTCGAEVMSEWRMCPDCGSRLSAPSPPA